MPDAWRLLLAPNMGTLARVSGLEPLVLPGGALVPLKARYGLGLTEVLGQEILSLVFLHPGKTGMKPRQSDMAVCGKQDCVQGPPLWPAEESGKEEVSARTGVSGSLRFRKGRNFCSLVVNKESEILLHVQVSQSEKLILSRSLHYSNLNFPIYKTG